MAVGLADRVVAVTADRGAGAPGGRYAFGSGCLVDGSTVLTAAHVVAGAKSVSIRTSAWAKRHATVAPGFVGDPGDWDPDHPSAPDLALLTLDEPAASLPPMPVAWVDRTHEAGLIERARSIGYPWFGEQAIASSGETVRVQVPVAGQLLLSSREDGRLVFQVTIAPPEGLSGSQWSGMSGAPIVANGRLIGVITEHPGRSGASTIAGTPLNALHADPQHPGWGTGIPHPGTWWARLNADPDALAKLPPPVEAPYKATLREFGAALHSRMPELKGRDDALAAIAAFATSGEPYRWLVGGAYTGKSSLLYEAITSGALPDSVDVVAYLLNRRASDASGARFLEAVVPQLEILCGWEHGTATRDRFNTAWQAAANADAGGRHLLLVVDALDEDLQLPGSPPVIDLLPRLTTGRTHVLVSSRPYPRVQEGLDPTHPLAQARRDKLAPFPGFLNLARAAHTEIEELITSGHLARDIVSVLAAAAGPLALADLTALHSVGDAVSGDEWDIEDLLTGAAARSLEPVGSYDAPRYQFAHTALLDHARRHSKIASHLCGYRDRIHAWADRWRDAGWPEPRGDGSGTPFYLLDTYPATLAAAHNQERLTALVGDIGWIDAAIRALGVDATNAALRLADTGQDERLAQLSAVVAAQTNNLRPPCPVTQPGYALRQLCYQACLFDAKELAQQLRDRLRASPPPGPVPVHVSKITPRPLREIGSHGSVTTVAIASDSRVVSGGRDGRVLLWDAETRETPLLLAEGEPVEAVVTHSDGRIFIGRRDGSLVEYEGGFGACGSHVVGTHPQLTALAVSSDGRVVSGGSDGAVRLWARHTEGWHQEAVGFHEQGLLDCVQWVRGVAALEDGRVVSIGTDGRVVLWDFDANLQPVEIGRHSAQVLTVAALPGGNVVTGGADAKVIVWDVRRPAQSVELGEQRGQVRALASLSDGRVVSCGAGGEVMLWDLALPGQGFELGMHDRDAVAVAVRSRHSTLVEESDLVSDQVVTAGEDGRLRLWSLPAPNVTKSQSARDEQVGQVAFLRSGDLVTDGNRNGHISLWKVDEGWARLVMGDYPQWVISDICELGDGRIIASCDDENVYCWDPSANAEPVVLGRHAGSRVRALAALEDDRVVSADNDGRIIVWDPCSPLEGVLVGTIDLLVKDETRDIVLTSVGQHSVVSGDSNGDLLLWDAGTPGASPKRVGVNEPIPGPGPRYSSIQKIASLANGDVVTGDFDGRVRIWRRDTPEQQPIELGRHDGFIAGLAVLRSQGLVASADYSWGVVRIWDPAEPGRTVAEIRCPASGLGTPPGSCSAPLLAIASGDHGWALWTWE